MKIARLFFLVSFIVLSYSVDGQRKLSIYRIRLECFNGDRPTGYLVALNDSSIRMIISIHRRKVDTVYSVAAIKEVSIRRKNSVGTGIAAGAGVGAGVGAMLGYMMYTPPECDGGFCFDFGPGFSAFGGAFLGGLIGCLVGSGIGSSYTKFPIVGNHAAYIQFREKILAPTPLRPKSRASDRTNRSSGGPIRE